MSRPARFRRTRVLIVGCGDVGLRVLHRLNPRLRTLALTSSASRVAALRQAGAVPVVGDLDDARTLARLSALAGRVLHLAPPPGHGTSDPRTERLLRALACRAHAPSVVYASTTGVYGDCRGERFDETRRVAPATDRAQRRVDAESRVRWYGRAFGARVTVLRVPGIYAFDRAGGDPRERVARGTPLLAAEDDVYTNHIHADDLARACVAALFRGRTQRVYHVSDDSEARMSDWYDHVADLAGLRRATRLSLDEARHRLSPMQLSFLGESRRLINRRLKGELRLTLRYPNVDQAFTASQ